MSKVKIKKESVGKKITVSSSALELLEAEVKRIKMKGTHFKINESKLASAIIEFFCLKHLNKDWEKIETTFFDKKNYLKTLIESSVSEDDLSKNLTDFLKSKVKK